MAEWKYIVHRQSDGEPLGEIDLRSPKVIDRLTGTSEITGTLSIDDPNCRRAMTGSWQREITALRDGQVAMHGPITGRQRSRVNAREMKLTVSSPQAYFHKRVTEHAHSYNREQLSIVRSLYEDAMAKTGGALYRLQLSNATSGVTKRMNVGGTERKYVAELVEQLAEDPDTGFDFRWDYTVVTAPGATQYQVTRILNFGYPTIGRDLSLSRVLVDSQDLDDLDDEEDGSRAANRVHVLGAGTGTKRLRAVGNSGTSLNQGFPLLEHIIERTDVKEQTRLNGMAQHAVRALMPVPQTLSSTHQISDSLPYGAVDLGDMVRVQTDTGGDPLDLKRRVVEITTDCQTDRVTFGYYAPQDEVVA